MKRPWLRIVAVRACVQKTGKFWLSKNRLISVNETHISSYIAMHTSRSEACKVANEAARACGAAENVDVFLMKEREASR